MELIKIYLFKILGIVLGGVAGILYLCGINNYIVVTMLCIAGIILFIDTLVNKDNIYVSNLKYLQHKSMKKK